MNWKNYLPVGLAVVLGLIAALIARDVVARKNALEGQAGKLTKVVVAKTTLAPGKELTLDDLAIGQISSENAPEHTFVNPSDLVGRATVTPIVRGQTIIDALLAPQGAGSGLQALIPDGMRAITIEVSEYYGMIGLIHPGCHVDVMATFVDDQRNETTTRTIVQNVPVTAVGPRLTPAPATDDQPDKSRSVTLLVSPKDAEILELTAATARPRVILRGGNDNEPGDGGSVSLGELRGVGSRKSDPFETRQVNLTMPATTQPSTQPAHPAEAFLKPERKIRRTIEIIRGGVESNIVFEMRSRPEGELMTGTTALE